jgi:hypothetical protein
MKPRFRLKTFTKMPRKQNPDSSKPKKARKGPVQWRPTPELEPLVEAYHKLYAEGKVSLTFNKLSTKIWEEILPMVIEAETADVEAVLKVAKGPLKKVADEARSGKGKRK